MSSHDPNVNDAQSVDALRGKFKQNKESQEIGIYMGGNWPQSWWVHPHHHLACCVHLVNPMCTGIDVLCQGDWCPCLTHPLLLYPPLSKSLLHPYQQQPTTNSDDKWMLIQQSETLLPWYQIVLFHWKPAPKPPARTEHSSYHLSNAQVLKCVFLGLWNISSLFVAPLYFLNSVLTMSCLFVPGTHLAGMVGGDRL